MQTPIKNVPFSSVSDPDLNQLLKFEFSDKESNLSFYRLLKSFCLTPGYIYLVHFHFIFC